MIAETISLGILSLPAALSVLGVIPFVPCLLIYNKEIILI